MLRLGDGAPSSQAAGGSENVQGVLYRAVLERWRRCHREGGLVVTELRSAEVALSEARKKEGATLLHHLLCSRDAVSMQASFHRWFAACARLDHLHSAQRASSKLRSERAALKEAEVQLALANDARAAADGGGSGGAEGGAGGSGNRLGDAGEGGRSGQSARD